MTQVVESTDELKVEAPEQGDVVVPDTVVIFRDPNDREEAEGDKVEDGTVVLYEPPAQAVATNADYRAMGYEIPEGDNDGDVPSRIVADKHVPDLVVVDGESADALNRMGYIGNPETNVQVKTTDELARQANPKGVPLELAESEDRVTKRVAKALKEAPSVKKVRSTSDTKDK